MTGLYVAFLIASLLHMTEEYFLPGGFMNAMKEMNPGFAPLVTVPMAVIVNGLQLALCGLVIVFGDRSAVFAMSVAALLLINSIVHFAGSVVRRKYLPGLVTGLLVYFPVAEYALVHLGPTDMQHFGRYAEAFMWGLAYQLVPLAYFLIAAAVRRRRMGGSE